MGTMEGADAEMDNAGRDAGTVIRGDRDRSRQCLPCAVGKASARHGRRVQLDCADCHKG
ncbi:hypothetical protein MESS4_250052 [Mesorhizobium sp. STM 4661]|nr:hypothetical protein MESS4_250052 [Mesorhizobium sp. STM 4661]